MKIINIGNSKNLFHYENHSHTFYEVIIIQKGQTSAIVNKDELILQKHSILVIAPGTEHEFFSDVEFSDVFIQTDFLPFAVNSYLLISDFNKMIIPLVNLLNKMYIKKKDYRMISLSLMEMLFEYIKILSNENYIHHFTPQIKNILEENISNTNFSLVDDLKSFGYNTDYIRRGFKEDTGFTPLEYLTNLRIQTAKNLLKYEAHLQIKSVALLCGFNDPYYFSRLFKKHTGLSPKGYQKKQ